MAFQTDVSAQNPEIGQKRGILRGFDEDRKIRNSVILRTYKAKMVDLDRVHHLFLSLCESHRDCQAFSLIFFKIKIFNDFQYLNV